MGPWSRPLGTIDGLRLVDAFGLAVLVVAAPLLVFPNRWSVLALVLLPVAWLARIAARPPATRPTAADWPLLGLLLMSSISLWPSVDLDLSRPKLYGLILGLYVFAYVAQNDGPPARRRAFAVLLVAAGLAVALIGLVGIHWSEVKLPVLGALYGRLPRVVTGVQTSFGTIQEGFHPNEVAGTLALLLPVPLGLALWARRTPARIGAALSALPLAATLLLTLSRSAVVGVTVALVILLVLRFRRLAYLLPIPVLGAGAMAVWLGPGRARDWLFTLQTATGSSTQGRLEVWDRAVAMVRDFPLTGIGLNTFPVIADRIYPFFTLGPDVSMPHAHNLYLQVAVDLGLPGLAGFLGIVAAAALGLARAWPRLRGWELGLAAGIGCGLTAHLLYSLTDAVALGAKPGVLLWAMLGAAVALGMPDRGLPAEKTAAAAGPRTGLGEATVAGNSGPAPGLPVGAVLWAQWGLFALACALGVYITVTGVQTFP